MSQGWSGTERDGLVVLVGVDRSESSARAARWAAGLGTVGRWSLQLAHVVTEARHEALDAPQWLEELSTELRRGGADVRVDLVVASDVGGELTRLSAEVDLVVVGSYGAGACGGVRVGFTALELLESVRCPVAVVRGREPGSPTPDHGYVVAGVDGSPESASALRLAAELAEGWGVTLLAVHTWRDVVEDPSRGLFRLHETWDKMASDAASLLAEALQPVRARHPDLDIERRVVGDTPLSALLDIAPYARLIVVGSRGVRPTPGMLMGSISRGLVEFAPCPVLVVRPLGEQTSPAHMVASELGAG